MRTGLKKLLSTFAAETMPYTPPDSNASYLWLAVNNSVNELDMNRKYFVDYYEEKSTQLNAFFKDQGFDVAGVLFKELRALKGDKIRKNGYIPDYGHEVDQLLPIMNLIQRLSPDERKEIEDMHGSMERWVCAVIAHDLGEDFNMFHEDLTELLKKQLAESGRAVTDHHADIIDHAGKSMECLTHYRKFKYGELAELLGVKLDLPKLKPGEVIPLPELKDALWDKMNVLDHGRDHLQVFATYHHNRKEPVITVTRYGGSQESAPEDEQDYRAEWNIYAQCLVSEDIYDTLTKLGDRVNGVATRPAMNADDPEKFDTYLDETDHITNRIGLANMVTQFYYPESPLGRCAHQLVAQLNLLSRMARIYIDHDPIKNPDGARGMSAANLQHNANKMGVSPIYLSEFFPACMEFYEGTDQESHPIGMMMRDFRQINFNPRFQEAHRTLYTQIAKALMEQGFDGMDYIIRGVKVNIVDNDWENFEPPADYPYADITPA